MPELPEAEASRRAIEEHCLNRTIEEAVPGEDTEHVDLPGANERARLKGHRFTEARRHGKIVFAGSGSGPWIAVHLGMTGRLVPYDEADGPPDYAKFIVRFEGERRLGFRNPRKLGWVKVIGDPDAFIEEEGYGPDALKIAKDTFAGVIGGTRGAVKSALMDQKKLAGIGNLWSDEIVFQTGIAPTARGSELSGDDLGKLFDATGRILEAVVKTGPDYAKLPDDWLIHHREEGADCPRCSGTITKTKVGSRTAYHCKKHQG